MENTNLGAKASWVNRFLIASVLVLAPLAGAYAACCAGHGGVASCNKATGYQMCKDGSASPTCTCAKGKNTQTKTTPATTTKSKSTTTTTNKTTPTTTTKTPTTKATKSTSGTSAKGCCSNHKGVAQCNKATGYQMCNDGSQSPSCTCH